MQAVQIARLLDDYEQARQWDAKMNEADNSGNVAGDALADAVRFLLAGEGMDDEYLPLYTERRCAVCGFWRGQHSGASVNDNEMQCPVDASWFEVTASFVPGREQGRDFGRA